MKVILKSTRLLGSTDLCRHGLSTAWGAKAVDGETDGLRPSWRRGCQMISCSPDQCGQFHPNWRLSDQCAEKKPYGLSSNLLQKLLFESSSVKWVKQLWFRLLCKWKLRQIARLLGKYWEIVSLPIESLLGLMWRVMGVSQRAAARFRWGTGGILFTISRTVQKLFVWCFGKNMKLGVWVHTCNPVVGCWCKRTKSSKPLEDKEQDPVWKQWL